MACEACNKEYKKAIVGCRFTQRYSLQLSTRADLQAGLTTLLSHPFTYNLKAGCDHKSRERGAAHHVQAMCALFLTPKPSLPQLFNKVLELCILQRIQEVSGKNIAGLWCFRGDAR